MRGDNGAAVWWLVPHRPAGPGWEEEEEERGGKGGNGGEERCEEWRREKGNA